jgi:hypothetical protein
MGTLSVNRLQAQIGSNIELAGNLTASGAIVDSHAKVVQYLYAVSGPARQTISSLTPVIISGLSLTITPKYNNSLIVIEGVILSSNTHVSSYGVFKDGATTVSTTGQTNNNEPNMQVTSYIGNTSADEFWTIPIRHHEISSNLTTRTYDIRATSGWSGTTYALHINNRSGNEMAGFSYMIVKEIKIS